MTRGDISRRVVADRVQWIEKLGTSCLRAAGMFNPDKNMVLL